MNNIRRGDVGRVGAAQEAVWGIEEPCGKLKPGKGGR